MVGDLAVHKAVILAAGAGSRMRSPVAGAVLTAEQRAAAHAGLKGLMPFPRPFLDFVLAALTEAGIDQVCLVVGPQNSALMDYAAGRNGHPGLSTALQSEPRGTADALASARAFTGADSFLVLNSDTFYPAAGLRGMTGLDGAGLLVVERAETLADPTSNLDHDRLCSFAIVETDSAGSICGLEEKPGRERYDSLPDPLWLSVNCWRFGPSIYEFCLGLEPSPRGELELPAAALAAAHSGLVIRPVATRGVLDLSTRADVEPVGRLLPGVLEFG